MKNKTTRVVALLMCLCLLVGALPMVASASNDASSKFANSDLDIAIEKNSTLAPGIIQGVGILCNTGS